MLVEAMVPDLWRSDLDFFYIVRHQDIACENRPLEWDLCDAVDPEPSCEFDIESLQGPW